MAVIRTQEKVPYVYVEKSRDYQVLCRGYDAIYNQIKYSIDSMCYTLSSMKCHDSVLPLLATKLGFNYYSNVEGDVLRIVLDGFPSAVKYKGSLLGIERAINIWLKTQHLETIVYVDVFNIYGGPYNLIDSRDQKVGGYIGQTMIPSYTIAIGIGGQPREYSLLEDILRYIKPTGYNLYFYFFSEFSTEQTPVLHASEDKASLVFLTQNINSVVRGAESDGVLHNLQGDVSITSAEKEVSDNRYTYIDGDKMGPYTSQNPNPVIPNTRGRVIGAVMSVEMIGSAPQLPDDISPEEREYYLETEGGYAAGANEGELGIETSFNNGAYEENE